MRFMRSFLAGLAILAGGAAIGQQRPTLTPSVVPGPTSTGHPAAVPPTLAPQGLHQLTRQDADAWLDGYMPRELLNDDIAGAVVVIVKDGQVLTARGYGYSDIARNRPVDPYRTMFRPGSVSKLFTWTAVMQQVEQGKLNLDRDVNAYLDFRIPPRDGKPITLRQIMTHTAGFEEAGKNAFRAKPADLRPIGDYLKAWVPDRIYAPGTTPAYSNWATTLAGYIVERVSGQSFDEYVEQHIFAPLGMRYATFRQPLPARLAPFMATGYPRASLPAKPFEAIEVGPAGSLSASGVDMARFMISHLQNGRGILQPATARMMHDSPLDRVDPFSLLPPLNRMELGFFESNMNGHEVVGHLGDTENFHTALHLFINDGVGIYLSVNSAGRDGAAHPLRVGLLEDFADRYFPASGRDGRIDAKTSAQHVRMMTGNWEGSRRGASSFFAAAYLTNQAKVSVGPHGELVIPALKGANGEPRRWDEIAPFVWREHGGHERLAAKLVDGKVVRWSSDGESPFIVFDRVPFSRSSTWILPLLYTSLGILALTFLYWPAAWLVRRRYRAPLAVEGNARRAYRATRIMAGLDVAVLIGWAVLITIMAGDTTMFTDASDPWLWLLQILGAVVFVGAVGIAGWNLWLTWRDGRRWPRKLWSVLVLLAALFVLYFAHAFGLLAMTVNY